MSKKNKHNNKLPCRNCLSLPMCKAKFDKMVKPIPHFLMCDLDPLVDKCSLLKIYLDGKGETTLKAKEKKAIVIHKFFYGLVK